MLWPVTLYEPKPSGEDVVGKNLATTAHIAEVPRQELRSELRHLSG
jgi:hypothetical protein